MPKTHKSPANHELTAKSVGIRRNDEPEALQRGLGGQIRPDFLQDLTPQKVEFLGPGGRIAARGRERAAVPLAQWQARRRACFAIGRSSLAMLRPRIA